MHSDYPHGKMGISLLQASRQRTSKPVASRNIYLAAHGLVRNSYIAWRRRLLGDGSGSAMSGAPAMLLPD
ncbi:hypothetical protein BN77_3476 [Rhizobium mesoamericanum STM3625]|uniref:Uncharacterized protein n=1 Tax=Rhizobium mesoamericanum STM3625 TaxID=1211777 RepID=K0PYE2_9HYPH|nr:hypothetical protein BN77_3476 [Rhizobium mesoamericanum STM3625]